MLIPDGLVDRGWNSKSKGPGFVLGMESICLTQWEIIGHAAWRDTQQLRDRIYILTRSKTKPQILSITHNTS